jgi:hypothetical protein
MAKKPVISEEEKTTKKKRKPVATEVFRPGLMAAEPLISMFTGALSLLPSYLRAGYGLFTDESDPEAAAALRRTQEALTYTPRTELGRAGLESIAPVAEVLSKPAEFVGQQVQKTTGSEVAGAVSRDVLDPLNVLALGYLTKNLRRGPKVDKTKPVVTPDETMEVAPSGEATLPPAPTVQPAPPPSKWGVQKPKPEEKPIVKTPDQVNEQISKAEEVEAVADLEKSKVEPVVEVDEVKVETAPDIEQPKTEIVSEIETVKSEISPEIDQVVVKADPELEQARVEAAQLPENIVEGIKEGERIAPTLATQRNITSAAKELLQTGQVRIDPSIPPFLQVANLLQSGRMRPDVYVEILKKNNLTPEQFAQSYVQEVSQAGRTLQVLSGFRQFTREAEDAIDQINTQSAGGIIDDRSIFRRIEDARRGLMVSQLSTAVRNGTVGVGRSILDSGTRLIDFGIQKATGTINPEMPMTTAGDAFGQVMSLLTPKQSFDLTKKILEVRPKEYDELFRQYNAGVSLGGKSPDILGTAEKGVYALNVFNRFQDSVFRSAIFADSVERGMKAKGLDLKEVIKSERMGDIPEDVVQRGVKDAMDFTFSAKPKTKSEQAIVTAIENLPGGTIAIPFPRFLINSMRFMTEYSPLGPLHLLNKNERAAIKAGDTRLISKSLAGSGLLYGAYALRDSEYAGEKWYEMKGEDGKTIDMRPYAPFSAYLFVGDVIKRNLDGTLYDLKPEEISEALAGIGSEKIGLQIVDSLIGEMRRDPEIGAKKAEDFLSKLAGEYAGTFFIPFQQVRDVMAEIDPELAKVRRVKEEPLTAPIKAKIPGLAEELPESFSYTNPQPRVREEPLMRQITGVTKISPKNETEKELDRLQIKEYEIFKRTGNVDADRKIAAITSKIIQDQVSEVLKGEKYQSMSDDMKRVMLKKLLTSLNTEAKNQAMKEDPVSFLESMIKRRLNRDELRVLESEFGLKIPEKMTEGAPVAAPVEPEKKAKGGVVSSGNIDVSKLPAVRNPDGSYSTVRSMGIEMDGKFYLIPTVINGRVVSDEEAIKSFEKTGKHLGIFGSQAESDAYAERLHQTEAKRIGKAKGGPAYSPAEQDLLRRYSSR